MMERSGLQINMPGLSCVGPCACLYIYVFTYPGAMVDSSSAIEVMILGWCVEIEESVCRH